MITLYLYENIIQYMEKEEIKEYIMPKEAMKYGKIKSIPIFEEAMTELIKKEKWSTLLYTKKMTIILPNHYEEVDKELLTNILNNNGIKRITYQRESNLFELKSNQIILNIHKNYLTLLKKTNEKKETKFYPTNIFKNQENMIKYIIEKYSSRYRYYLLGSSNNIQKILENLNDNKLFYYNDAKIHVIKKLIP